MKTQNYHGSEIFLPISETVGLSVDLVNIILISIISSFRYTIPTYIMSYNRSLDYNFQLYDKICILPGFSP